MVIIPAFNEQEALVGVLAELRALPAIEGVTIETVVVDDGSADRTSEVARQGGARVLRLCRNIGSGGAVQSGLRLARREVFDLAVQCDGDGQHPPSEIAKLVANANGADLVIGTRFIDNATFRSTPLRRLGIWWLRGVLRFVARVRISDPTSGFRLYGARALALFDETYPYDFPEPESLAIARAAGLKVGETAVAMRTRQGGTSSIAGFSTVYYMLKVTIAVVLMYTRSRRAGSKDDAAGS